MKKFFPIILFIVFSFFQIKEILPGPWYSSHDGIYHVVRAEKYFQELKNGQFPVRWVGDLDEGYGLPLFNYIYPTPYLFSSLFQFFGLSTPSSIKLVLFICYFLGLLGYYFLFKNRNQKLAILSSFVFGLTPFIFVDLIVRCAFGEFIAICFMPWVIYGFANKKSFLSTICLAIIITSHNFVGLLFFTFIIVYLLINRQFTKVNLISLVLSLGISSFFLIPMILEKNFVASGNQNGFTFDYRDHFVYPQQLIYGKWDYWYSLPGPNDGMSFQLGVANIFIFFIGLVVFLKAKPSFVSGFYLISYLFLVFLMTSFSRFVWQNIPPLQIIQFPWRFLAFTTFLSPLIFFESISKVKHFSFLLGTLIVLIAFYNVRNYRRPMLVFDQSRYAQEINLNQKKTTTASRHEVAPRWSPDQKFKTSDFQTTDEITTIFQTSTKIDFIQPSPESKPISVLRNYFPGWQLYSLDNSNRYEISPDQDGNISFLVPSGEYRLVYSGTLVQKISNILSLFSLAGWMLLLLKSKL